MKLETKHLAPYLAHKLQVEYKGKKKTLLGIKDHTPWSSQLSVCVEKGVWTYGYEITPILRPLTDLYKKLPEHEEIMDEFSEYSWEQFENAFFVLSRCNNCFDFITYSVAELLFKHHFDVFGLNEEKL